MKRTYVRATLTTENEAACNTWASSDNGRCPYVDLLQLVASCCDLRASGEDVWVNIGATRNGTSLLLTVHDGSNTYTAAGATLEELSADCRRLL